MYATTARYALVLAFALGAIHFNGASARAEKCSTAAPVDIETSLSWRFFSDALPDTVRTNSTKTISGGASFVRFSVRSYFTETSGSALSYSARSLNEAVVTVDEMCGSMLKINAVSANTATVRVTASANGMSATKTVTVTVTVADDATFPTSNNRPPEAEGTIADTTFTCKTSPVSFVVSPYFRDPDPKDDLTYAPIVSSAGVVAASVTDSTLTLTAVSKESATVTVTATDRSGANAMQVFRATIANSVPEAKGTIPDMTVAVGDTLVFDVSEYFEDCNNDPLDYAGASLDQDLASASMSDGALTITGLSAGRAEIVALAWEEPVTEIPRQYFYVTVFEENRPPIPVGTIPDTTLTLGGSSVNFDVSDYFEDPDGDTLRYTVSGPSSVTTIFLENDSTLTITPVSAGAGRVTVTATDPGGLSAAQKFGVEVSTTVPPLAVEITGPASIESGTEYTWEAMASGGVPSYAYSWRYATRCLNGNPIRDEPCEWEWINAGSGSTLTRTVTTTGTRVRIEVTATDSADPEVSVSSTHIVTVTQPESLKTVGHISTQTLTEGGSSVTLDVSQYFMSLVPDVVVTYRASSSNASIVTTSISGATLTISPEAVGSADVTVTATLNGESKEQVFIAEVIGGTPPPPLEVEITTGPTSIVSGTEYTWEAMASGGTSPYEYYWSYTSMQCLGTDCSYTFSPGVSTTESLKIAIETSDNSATLIVRVIDRATPKDTVFASINLSIAHPPVCDIPNQTLTAGGSAVTLNLNDHCSDDDGDTLTYEDATSSNTSVATTGLSGSTLTVTPVAKGSATVTVTANDGEDKVSPTFTVTVSNRPPVCNIPNQTLTAGGSAVTLNLNDHCSDDDGDTLTYEDATSSNTSVATTGLSGSTLTVTPVAKGSATVTVTANDGEDKVSPTFTVTVSNRPPVCNIPNQTLTAGGSAVTLNLNDHCSDDDGDTLTYEDATSSNTSVATTGLSGSTLTITPVAAGRTTVTVTADDGEDDVSQSVAVTVNGPLAVNITGPTSIVSGTSGRWEASATGGVSPYTYSWRYAGRCVNGGPIRDEPCEWEWINAGSGSTLTRTVTTPSDYVRIEVTATDSDSPAVSATVVHSVQVEQPNNPPVAEGTVAARTLTLGYPSASIGVSSWFSDPDDDPLTYTVSSSPSGIVNASIPQNGSTLTLAATAAGTATVTVTASDSEASATQSFDVKVNRKPVVSNNIAAQALTAGGASATFDLDDYFSDPDSDVLGYLAGSSSGAVNATVSGSTLTLAPVSAGSATVTVTARDPSGASVSQFVAVTVSTAAGLTASIDGPSSVNFNFGDGTTWTADVSGGTTPYTYSWRYRLCNNNGEGPGDRAEPICQWVSGGASSTLTLTLSDSTTLELTVTDDDGDSVTATLAVSFDL